MSRTIPCIRQMEDADCGAACLAMVLEYFGKRVDLSELRDVTGAGRDGVTALSIVNAARMYRLQARGVKVFGRPSYEMTAEVMGTPFDYPLSSRMDENDSILVFDRVHVPCNGSFDLGVGGGGGRGDERHDRCHRRNAHGPLTVGSGR